MKISKIVLMIVLLVPIYVVLISLSDINLIASEISSFDWSTLIFASSFIFLSQIVRALRWHLWIRKITTKITLKDNIWIYFSGLSLMATPARLGEMVRSVIIKEKYSIPVSKTIATLFIERFYELITLGILSSIALLFVEFDNMIVVIPVIITIIMIILVNKKELFINIINKFSKKRFLSKIIPNIIESTDVLHKLLQPKQLPIFILLSVFAGFLDMLGIYFLVIGLELNLNFAETILIISSTILIGFFSFIPGGLIAVEGSIIGLFSIKGIEYSESVLFLLFFRIVGTLLLSLIGVAALQKIFKKPITKK